MTEWRDIGSAPKDGTEVLGYGTETFEIDVSEDKVGAMFFMRWRGGYWRPTTPTARGFRGLHPSHWMPLPAPPAHEGDQ